MSETFHWTADTVDRRKRLTVTFPEDTEVTRDQAEQAIRELVDESEDATGETDGSRSYSRGHRA